MFTFLHSIVLPFPSVSRPSSNNCNKTVKTSGWALSTSSNSTTASGNSFNFFVNWPPSSWPIYPEISETQCENYGNLLSYFFDKNFVKAPFTEKILKSWFDAIFSQWEWIMYIQFCWFHEIFFRWERIFEVFTPQCGTTIYSAA